MAGETYEFWVGDFAVAMERVFVKEYYLPHRGAYVASLGVLAAGRAAASLMAASLAGDAADVMDEYTNMVAHVGYVNGILAALSEALPALSTGNALPVMRLSVARRFVCEFSVRDSGNGEFVLLRVIEGELPDYVMELEHRLIAEEEEDEGRL